MFFTKKRTDGERAAFGCSNLIDMHSHVLPAVDDGSESVEESLEMLRLSYSQGVRKMVATPHFYPHSMNPSKFLERREEAVKALAEAVFGDENAMIRLDMSEFMEKHTVSKLIGSPPGYVGYDDGGQLTEKVRRKPYSLILFDEIEKANEDVFNILLQIMDEGHLTDSQGRRVNFKNTIIVMTSNVGASLLTNKKQSLGFSAAAEEEHDGKELVMGALRQTFKPEFLNRIDETIVFRGLSKENLRLITKNLVEISAKRVAAMGIELEVDEEAISLLCEKGFDKAYGARPLRRCIQSMLEDAVAEMVLSGTLREGDKAFAGVREGKIFVENSDSTKLPIA